MPFARPTLTDLRNQVAQDIVSALPGSDALLRFSNLQIMGAIQAALAHLHYGYLDWIARQAVPVTSTDEFLVAWAGLKAVIREPATQASGVVTFSGTVGTPVPSGTPIVRGDGVQYLSTANATVGGGGTVAIMATAIADPAGKLGATGNCSPGTSMSLGTSIPGMQSTGSVTTVFTGGADLETDDSLRSRMLQAYQSPPEIGTESNYIKWARAVSGVSRAWCKRNGMGTGRPLVFIMLDAAESAFSGFPQGTDGVATGETRDTAATGDQLAVANYIFSRQPVGALVYVASPSANSVNFTINGISSASAATKAAIAAAIDDAFLRAGSPGDTFDLSILQAAIAAVPRTAGFVITSPAGNIAQTGGQLPVRGTVTYT